MGRFHVLAVLLGLTLFALPGLGGEEPPLALSSLRATPAAHLGDEVSFVFQLDGEVDTWNPYLTRFGPGDHQAFRGWSDDAFLWERPSFEDALPYLFARRGSPAAATLAAGRNFERFEVTGIVREVFLGEPWIEVTMVTRLVEHVSEGAILHAVRGLELLRQGQPEMARAQLERARAGLLPSHAAEELDRLLEACE